VQQRILTSYADLNRHLTLINVKSDALCFLCQEEDESSLHFLGKCTATMRIRFALLRVYLTDYSDLRNLQWSSLLKCVPRPLKDCTSLLSLWGCTLCPLFRLIVSRRSCLWWAGYVHIFEAKCLGN